MTNNPIFIAAVIVLALVCSFVGPVKSATVIGQQKFSNNSAYTAGIDGRFKAYTMLHRITTTDPRLSDARPPTAHTQAASTITGLATVATSGVYNDLSGKPTIPAAQINSDWSASSGIAQIFNKPTIPSVCGADPSVSIYDGRTPMITFGNGTTAYKLRVDGVTTGPSLKGTDGLAGTGLTCWIASATASTNYDANGVNPLPALQPFYPYLYRNGVQVVPLSYTWSVSTSKTLLSGSGTGSSFTPDVFSTYSASKGNNWVSVMLNYSGRSCRATLPVVVTKTGATGAQGPPGSQANVTEATVTGAFDSTPSTNSLNLRTTTSDDTVKFRIYNINSQLTLWATGKGRLVIQEGATGIYRWQFDPAVMQMLMKDANNVTRIVASAVDGSVMGYKGNGTAVAFKLWSSGMVL